MNIYLRGTEDFHACPNSRKQKKKMFDKAKFKFAKVKEYSLDSSLEFALPEEIDSATQPGAYIEYSQPKAFTMFLFVVSYVFFFTYYSIAALTNNLKIKLDKE